jgi:hypothetical protein
MRTARPIGRRKDAMSRPIQPTSQPRKGLNDPRSTGTPSYRPTDILALRGTIRVRA